GGVRVVAHYLNHPALTLGYRLEADGGSVVYAGDHEPHMRDRPQARRMGSPGGAGPAPRGARPGALLGGGDPPMHRAPYTPAEYPDKINWGHCPAEPAVDYALAAHVRRLALTHHDPLRDDDAVDRVVAACRERAREAGSTMDIFGAAEGMSLEPTRRDIRPS